MESARFHKRAEERRTAKESARKQQFIDSDPRTKYKTKGRHTHAEWLNLLVSYGYRCAYCRRDLTDGSRTKDHRIPLSRGGSDCISNILPACRKCNSMKGDLTAEEFIAKRPAFRISEPSTSTAFTSIPSGAEIDKLIHTLAEMKSLDRFQVPNAYAQDRLRQKTALSHWLQLKYRGQRTA